jgi:hypothetical protein
MASIATASTNYVLELGGTTAVNNFSTTTPYSEIVFAVMYNTDQETVPLTNNALLVNNTYNNKCFLNPYGVYPNDAYNCDIYGNMGMSEFLNIFYPNSAGYFNVNRANATNPAIVFSRQTYSAANSQYNNFSLTQVMLRAYCVNNGLSVNDLNPATIILVNKECSHFKSLSALQGTVVSLNWGEVIESLLSQGSVDLSGNAIFSTYESIPLVLIVNFRSEVLNTNLQIKFIYYVNIQGYSATLASAAQTTYNGGSI